MRRLVCLLPLLVATGCIHTGSFEAPVPVPAGRALVSVGGMAAGRSGRSGSEEVPVLASVEGRIDFSPGPLTVSLRGTPSAAGVGARLQMPTPFPLALIGGGGIAIERSDCDPLDCASGASGYAGVSVGAPAHKGWVPYLSARLVASQIDVTSCDEDVRTCRSQPATDPLFGMLSLGLAPTRGGVHVETGVSVHRSGSMDGRDERSWRLYPSFGVLARVLL